MGGGVSRAPERRAWGWGPGLVESALGAHAAAVRDAEGDPVPLLDLPAPVPGKAAPKQNKLRHDGRRIANCGSGLMFFFGKRGTNQFPKDRASVLVLGTPFWLGLKRELTHFGGLILPKKMHTNAGGCLGCPIGLCGKDHYFEKHPYSISCQQPLSIPQSRT